MVGVDGEGFAEVVDGLGVFVEEDLGGRVNVCVCVFWSMIHGAPESFVWGRE